MIEYVYPLMDLRRPIAIRHIPEPPRGILRIIRNLFPGLRNA